MSMSTSTSNASKPKSKKGLHMRNRRFSPVIELPRSSEPIGKNQSFLTRPVWVDPDKEPLCSKGKVVGDDIGVQKLQLPKLTYDQWMNACKEYFCSKGKPIGDDAYRLWKKVCKMTIAQRREAYVGYICSKYLTEPIRSQAKKEFIDYEGFYVSADSALEILLYRDSSLWKSKFLARFAIEEGSKKYGYMVFFLKALRCNAYTQPGVPTSYFITFETWGGDFFEAVIGYSGGRLTLEMMRPAVHYPKVPEIYEYPVNGGECVGRVSLPL